MLRIPTGESALGHLHVRVCEWPGGVIAYEMAHDPAFDGEIRRVLPAGLLDYVTASPRPDVVLNAAELRALIEAVEHAGYAVPTAGRFWECDELPGYLDHRVALAEIAAAIGTSAADTFADRSRAILDRLVSERMRLERALELIAEWISEIEDTMRACGMRNLLPRPEGKYPTPTRPGKQPRRQRRCAARSNAGEISSVEPGEWLSTEQIRKRVRRRREFVIAAMDCGRLPYEQRGRGRYVRFADVEAWEKSLIDGDDAAQGALIHPDLSHLG